MTNSKDFDVVFYEAFEEEEKVLREVLPAGKRYLFTWKAIQESGHEFPPAPVVSTRTQSKIPHAWADCLDGIVTRSTGYDHVTAYLKETGADILTAYLPEYAARAVAEQAMLLWAALLRNLRSQQVAFASFSRDGLTGNEIRGRNILVVGVGRIGSQIVDIASALGMKLKGVDLLPDPNLIEKYGLEYVSLEDGIADAEIVVCALPLTELTRGMLDYALLSKMPAGGIFVNIARGEISPFADLRKLLDEGVLAGLGMDVYDYEKELAGVLRGGASLESVAEPARSSVSAILESMDDSRVILTPHNAFNTEESVFRKSKETSRNLSAYFETGSFLTPCCM